MKKAGFIIALVASLFLANESMAQGWLRQGLKCCFSPKNVCTAATISLKNGIHNDHLIRQRQMIDYSKLYGRTNLYGKSTLSAPRLKSKSKQLSKSKKYIAVSKGKRRAKRR